MKHLLKLPLCALAFAMTANTGFAQSSATGLKDAYKPSPTRQAEISYAVFCLKKKKKKKKKKKTDDERKQA